MKTTYTFGLFSILLAFPTFIYLIMIIRHRYMSQLSDENDEAYEDSSEETTFMH